MAKARKVVLAFSGGLDTSFCVVYLRRELGMRVVTVTVDTGGFDKKTLRGIERRARECGAETHITVDGRRAVYDDFVSWIIKGNILRGDVYPLCVAAERVAQAREVLRVARRGRASAIAHGSTGAGNDQVRFDIAAAVLAPDVEILAPIRELGLSRAQETASLREAGIAVEAKTQRYSINESLWGSTIGGGETHDPARAVPDSVFTFTTSPKDAPGAGTTATLRFERGLPVALGGKRMHGLDIVAALNRLGARHGIGRGMHMGDTVLGIKGRIAFEAPGPLALIVAHRELEKLVLTKWQRFFKRQAGEFYGNMLHEGQYFDPVMRDLEALLDSSQDRVTGNVRVRMCQGRLDVVGMESPYSMMNPDVATYGEGTAAWSGRDVEGFSRIAGMPGVLAARALASAASARDSGKTPGKRSSRGKSARARK